MSLPVFDPLNIRIVFSFFSFASHTCSKCHPHSHWVKSSGGSPAVTWSYTDIIQSSYSGAARGKLGECPQQLTQTFAFSHTACSRSTSLFKSPYLVPPWLLMAQVDFLTGVSLDVVLSPSCFQRTSGRRCEKVNMLILSWAVFSFNSLLRAVCSRERSEDRQSSRVGAVCEYLQTALRAELKVMPTLPAG